MTGRRTGFVRKGPGHRRDLVRQEIARSKPEKRAPRARPPDRVDYSTYRLTAREWLLYGACGIGACGLASYVFYRSAVVFLILIPFGACYPLYRREDLKKERARRLELQFKEGIQVLSSFLSAGYSLENGLALSIKELEVLFGRREMITEEFRILCDGIRMNRPAEDLFMDFGRRSGLRMWIILPRYCPRLNEAEVSWWKSSARRLELSVIRCRLRRRYTPCLLPGYLNRKS